MPPVVALTLAALATVAATGLGVIPVMALGAHRVEMARAGLAGTAAGAMLVAAVVGLIAPGLDGHGLVPLALGAAAGALLIAVVHTRLEHQGFTGADREWKTVATALFVHSFPEGLAIGTAFASDRAGLDLLVVLAIAAQNVPEGTATALPMQAAGMSSAKQTLAALVTSAPQVVGALAAFALVATVKPLLPVSFGFAAGAMIALVVSDVGPSALTARHRVQGVAGLVVGGVLMMLTARYAGA